MTMANCVVMSYRHLGMGFGRIMSFLGNGVRRGANSVIDKPKRLANRRRAQHRGSAQQLDVQLEEAEPAQQQSGHPLQRYTPVKNPQPKCAFILPTSDLTTATSR